MGRTVGKEATKSFQVIEQTFPRREMFRIEEYTYCLRNTDRKRP
jgi:hypothetical protein